MPLLYICYFQGISMVMKDFDDNNRQLIMLRPNADVLKSIQSMSSKPILTAKSDVDLITTLSDLKDVERMGRDSKSLVEINTSNCKIVTDAMDEFTTTKL